MLWHLMLMWRTSIPDFYHWLSELLPYCTRDFSLRVSIFVPFSSITIITSSYYSHFLSKFYKPTDIFGLIATILHIVCQFHKSTTIELVPHRTTLWLHDRPSPTRDEFRNGLGPHINFHEYVADMWAQMIVVVLW